MNRGTGTGEGRGHRRRRLRDKEGLALEAMGTLTLWTLGWGRQMDVQAEDPTSPKQQRGKDVRGHPGAVGTQASLKRRLCSHP